MAVDQAVVKINFDAATTGTGTTNLPVLGYAVEFWFVHPEDTTGASTFSLEVKEVNGAGEQISLDLDTETIATFATIAAPIRQLTDSAGAAVTGMYGAYLMCGTQTVTLTYDSAVTGDAVVMIRYTT